MMQRQIELAKRLLESKGYSVTKIDEDYRDSNCIIMQGHTNRDLHNLMDDLGYSGAVQIEDNRIYADETTLRQIMKDLELEEGYYSSADIAREDRSESEQERYLVTRRGRKPNADLKDDGVFTPDSEEENLHNGVSGESQKDSIRKYDVYYVDNNDRTATYTVSAHDEREAENIVKKKLRPIHIDRVVLIENQDAQEGSIEEATSDNSKFRVGDILKYSMLYGGMVSAKVISRTDDTLTIKENWVAEDTGEDASNTEDYTIHIDEEGVEYIIIWEYYDHRGVAYPPAHTN